MSPGLEPVLANPANYSPADPSGPSRELFWEASLDPWARRAISPESWLLCVCLFQGLLPGNVGMTVSSLGPQSSLLRVNYQQVFSTSSLTVQTAVEIPYDFAPKRFNSVTPSASSVTYVLTVSWTNSLSQLGQCMRLVGFYRQVNCSGVQGPPANRAEMATRQPQGTARKPRARKK